MIQTSVYKIQEDSIQLIIILKLSDEMLKIHTGKATLRFVLEKKLFC